MSTNAPEIGWRDLMSFFSPAGQNQIKALIDKAKEERGEKWIDAIQNDYPMFSWIIEITCTMDAEAAFVEIKNAYPQYPLSLAKNQLIQMHGWLRAEIERKR